jgi:nitrate/TMAO reductase-like tetraheme cytochrome c subunit
MNPAGPERSWWARLGRMLLALLSDFLAACWEVGKLPFVLIGIGFKRFFGLGARKIILLVVAAVIVTIIAASAFIQATSQPGFCVTCHVMVPYFDAWRTSTHNNVSCVTCHVPPGLEGTLKHKFMALSMVANYVTGLYKRSKPWAEIEDAACLREGCHETRLLKGTENFKGVRFDHRPHLVQPRRDLQLRCTSCHAQIVQGLHISVTEGTCFLCHFKPDSSGPMTALARCTHCHHPSTGANARFDHASVLARGVDCSSCHSTAVSGDGYVPPERCSSCHAKVEHIQRYGDFEFVHRMHVTEHKVECLQCHIAIRHGRNVAGGKDPSQQCAACHGAQHEIVEAVWTGELPGLVRTPSVMAQAGMTCVSCHSEPIHGGGRRQARSAPRCTLCHEESYNRLWPMWVRPLRAATEKVKNRAYSLRGVERDTLLRAIKLYQAGDPIHNPSLLPLLEERVTGSAASVGPCVTCHPAPDNLVPTWQGRTVPHEVHVRQGISCETCHFADSLRHGKLTSTARACDQCHHRSAAENNCAKCHDFQARVYRGTLSDVPGAEPSVMAAAEVACTDCHAIQSGVIERPNAETCTGCHEAGYADTLRTWQIWGDSLANSANPKYQGLAAALRRDGSRSVHNPPLFRKWAQRMEVKP